MSGAYYNEHDPFAAAWLRELIKAGLIAPGEVDERSIEDVAPSELSGFTQCHFFAGIGIWSYALRSAGWADDRPVWTGSCPCQPFSAAGKGEGIPKACPRCGCKRRLRKLGWYWTCDSCGKLWPSESRDLWPSFFHLIENAKPRTVPVFGEQVASKDGLAWLDLVAADLEGAGYAFGAVDTCAAGFGAPHIRQRLYWVADSVGERRSWQHSLLRAEEGRRGAEEVLEAAGGRAIGRVADSAQQQHNRAGLGRPGRGLEHPDSGAARWLADSECDGGWADQQERGPEGRAANGRHPAGLLGDAHPRPTDGHWRDADWLLCRDGKWRPVEPGSFPLAHGAAARVGRLRGYGNGLVSEQATEFVKAYSEIGWVEP